MKFFKESNAFLIIYSFVFTRLAF